MFTLTATTTVPAPLDIVFDRITDIDRLPDWNAEISRVVASHGSVVPGAEWVVHLRAMGTQWDSRSRAVDVDRTGGRFAYRSQSDDGNPSWADWTWELAEHDGVTDVRVRAELNPKTFWRRRLLVHLRRPFLRRAMRRSLVALAARAALEPRPQPTA
jgi:uncharacterized protein YndB with AHSA1/START domain